MMNQASPKTIPRTLESYGPAAQEAYNGLARDNANQANTHFDYRFAAAKKLAGTVTSTVRDKTQIEAAKDMFTWHDQEFKIYKAAGEVAMPPFASFEIMSEVDKSLASPEVLGAMSHEQQAFALEARTALAAGKLKEHGVTEESLKVVMTESDKGAKFTLVHTGNGVDMGNSQEEYDPPRSYNEVMSGKNDKVFQIQVGDNIYDSRKGMTSEVYKAKREQGLYNEIGDVSDWTLMTGEELTADGGVQVLKVLRREVESYVDTPRNSYWRLRVCPAVEIPDLAS